MVNIFDPQAQDVDIESSEQLKSKFDSLDSKNIIHSFSKTRDPIVLALENLDNRPLNKVAQDFLKDIFVDAVCFISKVL